MKMTVEGAAAGGDEMMIDPPTARVVVPRYPATPGTCITCRHPPHATSGAPGGGCNRMEHEGHAMSGGGSGCPPAGPPLPPPGMAITWWHPPQMARLAPGGC